MSLMLATASPCPLSTMHLYTANVVLLAYCGSRQLKKILVAGFMDVDGFLFHLADVNHFLGLTQNSQTI